MPSPGGSTGCRAAAGSLPASAPPSPDSRAERSTITSSDSPLGGGRRRGARRARGATLCIQARSARFFASARCALGDAAIERHAACRTMSSTAASSAPISTHAPLALGELRERARAIEATKACKRGELHGVASQVPLACTCMRPS